MDTIKRFIYFVKHSFTGCNEKDLDMYKDLKATCKKCGRTHFIFKSY